MNAIEASVIARIEARAQLGLSKYGTSMERSDLSRVDWLRHAQEEALDLAIYLERLIDESEAIKEENAKLKDEVERLRKGIVERDDDAIIPAGIYNEMLEALTIPDLEDVEQIEVGPGNYYGSLKIKVENGSPYWCVENYDKDWWEECPTEVAVALLKAKGAGS